MNSDDRANMPTPQPSLTSLRTNAAPKPGPTPATIATRFFFASTINVGSQMPCYLAVRNGDVWTAQRAVPTNAIRLFGQLFRRLRRALGDLAIW